MKRIVVVIAIFLLMGCTTIQTKDVCLTVQTGKTTANLCKSEAKNIPPDFPDELFVKWFSLAPSHFYGIDIDQDEIPDEVVAMWMDANGNPLAAIHLAILPNGMRAWALVEFNGAAHVAWVGKNAT